ncbi:MAG: hypothetical protein JW774_11715 [Candidatus Aureabacteria bacterium]|nr:hypothetical protein [Candidatus Auribacterota bacterium]
MKAFKILFFLLILLIGAVLSLYKYGPPDVKKEIRFYFEKMGIDEKIAELLGEKKIPKEDELLIKTDYFYFWKDLEGNEHYVTSLSEVPLQYREQVKSIDSNEMGGTLKIMDKKQEAEFLNEAQGKPIPTQLKNASFQIFIYSFKNDPYLAETKEHFDKYNLPYSVFDVIESPEHAAELKVKLGLDINKKYDNINLPVVEINGEIVERCIDGTDENGRVKSTSLNTVKINKILGLRATFE